MGYLSRIENCSEQHEEYTSGAPAEARKSVKTSEIEVFPTNSNNTEDSGNTDSCVIVKKQPKKQTDNTTKPSKVKKASKVQKKNNGVNWIRETMPSTHDTDNIASAISNHVNKEFAKGLNEIENPASKAAEGANNDNSDNVNNNTDAYDLFKLEGNGENIEEMFDSNDDQGSGKTKLLKNYFEKDVPRGFNSNSFVGTNFIKDDTNSSSELNATVYSDNSYCSKNGKTSVIFGGTASVNYMSMSGENATKKVDFNAYAYGKHRASYFTYGGGVMHVNNDGVKNTEISAGAMENSTGIYAIFQKEFCAVPGLPTHSRTHLDVGIGRRSGLLDPDEYNPKNRDIEEISSIDDKEACVEDKQSNLYPDTEDDKPADGHRNPIPNTNIDLIIEATDNHKEYGIKGAHKFSLVKKENNYTFIQPFGKLSNTVVDTEDDGSKEGLKILLGANVGQNITFGNGWNLKTKGLVEVSRDIVTGSKPADNFVANAKIIAENTKFRGELGLGMFLDSAKNYCRYIEAKISYVFNSHISAYAKAGTAKLCFDGENSNRISQFAVGAHLNF